MEIPKGGPYKFDLGVDRYGLVWYWIDGWILFHKGSVTPVPDYAFSDFGYWSIDWGDE